MAFLLPLDPPPTSLAWCGLSLEPMKDQLPIPFLKAGGQQTLLKHCKLPGGCLEDWSLSYLTQISDGEKQQPLVMKAAMVFQMCRYLAQEMMGRNIK